MDRHRRSIDAAFTLWLYLIDMVGIEQTLLKLYKTKPRFIRSGHRGYKCPINHHMGGLVKDVLNQIKDWPDSLKINLKTSQKTQEKDKIKQKYYSENFINGEPDYKRLFPNKHNKSIFTAHERHKVRLGTEAPFCGISVKGYTPIKTFLSTTIQRQS